MTAPSSLAPHLEAFFTRRLVQERGASPHTIASYRDSFRLLVRFAQERLRRAPSRLVIADLDAPFITSFLEHLERGRRNSVRTRNARLAAIHSFFRYLALQEPGHAAIIQRVLSIPSKRSARRLVDFLGPEEREALLAAPDRHHWLGRRDHMLLLLALQTGLRVSELTGLRRADIVLGAGAHVRCRGKGRKERCTPLRRSTVDALRVWLAQIETATESPLLPTARGTPMSRDAVERLLARHVATATPRCPSLANKRVSPHVLRHSTAMELLQAGVDRSVIALWLGHESIETTQIYLDADLRMKERALARTAGPEQRSLRYRPEDRVLAFLQGL